MAAPHGVQQSRRPRRRTHAARAYLTTSLISSLLCAVAAAAHDVDTGFPYAPVPQCKANEGLCPKYPGSVELRCVDFTAPETCGGCVTDGVGLDCSSDSTTFMNGCTRRGQCTGCRWQRGGLNQSLTLPDYLHCSITHSAPMKRLKRDLRTEPVLSYARSLSENKLNTIPLAAHIKQDQYASEETPKELARAKAKREKSKKAELEKRKEEWAKQDAKLLKEADIEQSVINDKPQRRAYSFDMNSPETLPNPPAWLVTFLSQYMSTFPKTTDNDALLWWMDRFREPLLQAAELRSNLIAKKLADLKRTNADRFKNAQPPAAPKGLKKALSKKELLALQEAEERPRHDFWSSILQQTIGRSLHTRHLISQQYMDTLWELISRIVSAMQAEQDERDRLDPPKPGTLRAKPKVQIPLQIEETAEKRDIPPQRPELPPLKAENLPSPPDSLQTIVADRLSTVPLSTSDEPLVAWVRSLAVPISQAMQSSRADDVAFPAETVNDEPLRYLLDPQQQQQMRNVPTVNEDIPGLAMKRVSSFAQEDSAIWYRILGEITTTTTPVTKLRGDIVDALWELVARVAAKASAKEAKPGPAKIPRVKQIAPRQRGARGLK